MGSQILMMCFYLLAPVVSFGLLFGVFKLFRIELDSIEGVLTVLVVWGLATAAFVEFGVKAIQSVAGVG